jgi:hypothetical protein
VSIASNGAADGIVLNTTGSTGGLTVAGNAGTCTTAPSCTGGAIQSSTGAGISLTSVGGGVALSHMFVSNGSDDGIFGSSVTGFSMDNSQVNSNGNAANERGFDFTNLSGTVGLTSDTVNANHEDGFKAVNSSGNLSMTVTNGAYSNTAVNDGIALVVNGTGTHSLNIQSATFTNNVGDHVQFSNDSTSGASLTGTVNNATMTANPALDLGGGIDVRGTAGANITATVTNNSILGAVSPGVNLTLLNGTGTLDATVTGNTINAPGNDGILVETADISGGHATINTLIQSNLIRGNPDGTLNGYNEAGIGIFQHHSTIINATLWGNTIRNPKATALNGIRAQAGETGSTDNGTVCLDAGHATTAALKNSVKDSGVNGAGQPDIRLLQRGNTTFKLQAYAGAFNDITAVATYLKARNDGNGTPTATAAFNNSPGYVTAASCPLP